MRPILILSLLLLAACQSKHEQNTQGLLVGPAAGTAGGAYQFFGTVDHTYTSTCGSAGPAIATTTTTPTTGGTGATAPASQTVFGIESFYVFTHGETLSLRYNYDSNAQSFTFSPQNASATTCQTNDLVSCVSGGSFTCSTADNLHCGGTFAFLFRNTAPAMVFQALSGPLTWKDFTLNNNKTAVSSATLQFHLIGTDGSVFTGTTFCDIPQ